MASNITVQSVLAEISQDHLECPICSERYKQPKLLKCSHSFCLECLQQIRQNSPKLSKLSCPVCRQDTLLKENGIDGLQTDFKTLSLLEGIETHETHLKKQQAAQLHVPSQEYISKCSKHKTKDLNMFCNQCKKVICTTCIVTDHQSHSLMEIREASDKCTQHAAKLVAQVRQRINTFKIAIQEIDKSRKTFDSMFASTKEKISQKADEEIAKEVARITEEKQKLMQEAEQIYKDRVKTMETARATNSKKMNKAELKQYEVNQLMDQGNKIAHHIEQLLHDLKEYREMKSTKVPDGLTYMDFKEGQKSLGSLMLKDEHQAELETSAQATKPTFQPIKHFKLNNWTLKSEKKLYQNFQEQRIQIYPRDVAVYSNSDIVVSCESSKCLFTISTHSNSPSTCYFIPQELPIKGLTAQSRVTVNKNDELIILDGEAVKIFNRNYQLLHQFYPVGWSDSNPSCIAVDDNNLIALAYRNNAEISLHKPDGSHFRRLSAPGIVDYLTTYKQRLIYTNWANRKLVSVDYNGTVVFSVITHSGMPRGVWCDKDGSIYVCVERGKQLSTSGDIHHYSPDGEYIGCIIKDCVYPRGITVTPAGDLVVATDKSVQIYHHE